MGKERSAIESASIYYQEVTAALDNLPLASIARVIDRLDEARSRCQVVFTCGNGGSAATAIHFASDLAKGASVPGKRAFRALSLCENISLLTAWANDSSYDDVFSERLAPWVEEGDVLVAFSGGGNSPNVLNAVLEARAAGAYTVGMTGFDGGKLRQMVDLCVCVQTNCMEQIEDLHLLLCHMITRSLRALPARTILENEPPQIAHLAERRIPRLGLLLGHAHDVSRGGNGR